MIKKEGSDEILICSSLFAGDGKIVFAGYEDYKSGLEEIFKYSEFRENGRLAAQLLPEDL